MSEQPNRQPVDSSESKTAVDPQGVIDQLGRQIGEQAITIAMLRSALDTKQAG